MIARESAMKTDIFPQNMLPRALLLSLASNASVLGVMEFGLALWPERLPVNTQNVFWLASGVNTAGLLLLGPRWWPLLILNAFPPWLLGIESLAMCLIGATTNALEALLGAWLILRLGAFAGRFDRLRPVGALVAASLIAPLTNTVLVPAYMCAAGLYPWSEYGHALGHWNLSNGASTLFLVPLLFAVLRRDWTSGPRVAERLAVALLAATLSFAAFGAVFRGTGTNFAFVVFPVVLYTAVRFGIGETSAVLGIVLISIFGSLALDAPTLPPAQMPALIWFVQAFCWVLAATSLLMAALAAERRRAEVGAIQASLETERARLAALRYQINPHFLFNALNSVRAALPLTEPVAREMITDLAGYLRSTLDGGEADTAPLRDEIKSVRDYLAIERRRAGDRLQAEFHIAPDAEGKTVPAFLLQPLVENAIRHGLETSWEPCHITVTARVEDSRLRIEVANTGNWRDPGERRGVGLENVRKRLRLLHGEQARFTIAFDDGMVRVQIELPIS